MMDTKPGTIGILLMAPPAHAVSRAALALAEAALEAGHAVELFLMEDGLYHALPTGYRDDPAARLERLAARGMKVAACTYNATVRGLGRGRATPVVELAGQEELARLVENCDRFLSFG